jgi:dihydropteroate synthase
VQLGDGFPVRIMGVINVSPESFFKESVRSTQREISKTAKQMQEEGADLIDIGARSTAPYLDTAIPIDVEKERMKGAIEAVSSTCSLPISADTISSEVAREALRLGVSIINDVSGLKSDPDMAHLLASKKECQVIVVARTKEPSNLSPIERVLSSIGESLSIAAKAGLASERLTVDPGIGFASNVDQVSWNTAIISQLARLREFCRPICVGVSRKRFIGKIISEPDPKGRLYGSLAAEAICVLNSAHLVRTHNVKQTLHAVRVAESIRSASETDNT